MKQQKADVLIVGAGVIGLACGLALQQAGRRVQVIDATAIGAGASHGNCGTITPSHAAPLASLATLQKALQWLLQPDAPLYLSTRAGMSGLRWLLRFALRCNHQDWRTSAQAKAAILNDARQRLPQWVKQYQLDCAFVETGEDFVFKTEKAFLHEQHELALLDELGIAAQVLDAASYLAQEPAIKPEIVGAIRFAGDAALRPDQYVAELARALQHAGGIIHADCALHGLQQQTSGWQVHCSRGRWAAQDVVIATGAWSALLGKAIHLPWLAKVIQPGKGYSITYTQPAQVPRRPLMLKEPMVCVSHWPGGFRLGSTMEFAGFDSSLNVTRLAALERGAAQFLHTPVGAKVQQRWCGWRPMSVDDVPLIGPAPGLAHLWLATGHGMMGVGMSTATAQLLTDLMTGQTPALDAALYSPQRFV